jgi:hypothetical protein
VSLAQKLKALKNEYEIWHLQLTVESVAAFDLLGHPLLPRETCPVETELILTLKVVFG